MLFQGCASTPPAPSPGEAAHAEAKAAYLANDYQRTLAIVEPLAVGGEAWAQYTLGYMYYYGRGVAMDRQMAKQWIQRAAQQGYGPAQQAQQRLSASAPKHNTEEEMEPPAGNGAAGRAPMPVPPSSGATPATPTPSPDLTPGKAPLPSPAPETANPLPAPPAGEAAPAAPPQENTTPMGEAPAAPPAAAESAPAGTSPPAAAETPPPTSQTPAHETPAPAAPTASMPVVSHPPSGTDHVGSNIKGAGWIATQDPQHYTLQLIAAGNEAAVVDFIRRHHLEPEAAYFARDRNGKPWYTVIYGSFGDREAARTALGRLPAAVNQATPWIRRFEDVQTRLGQ
jgi:DamX protein